MEDVLDGEETSLIVNCDFSLITRLISSSLLVLLASSSSSGSFNSVVGSSSSSSLGREVRRDL